MLTIGQMSKACSVTVKTLRHYDKIGLLRACEVDRFTGYRYYSEDQIGRMLLIDRLKRYGFSLSDIQGLMQISDPGEMERQLKRQRFRLERELEHLQITIRELNTHLDDFERTGDVMSYQNQYEVVLKQSEEKALLTERHNMSVEEFGTYYSRIFQKIVQDQIESTGVTLAIYHDDEFDAAHSDVELAVEITDREKADCILESRLCATTIHRGAYSGLPDAYGKVFAWLKAEGYQLDGAPFEIYLKTAFDKLPPEEWETEIYFPVRR